MYSTTKKRSLPIMNRGLDLDLGRVKPRAVSVSSKRRLSVTELLECAEVQAENISNMFPMIDNEKYHANYVKSGSVSDSGESIDDIGIYINEVLSEAKNTMPSSETDVEASDKVFKLKREVSSKRKVSLERLQNYCIEERSRTYLRKMSMPVVIADSKLAPPDDIRFLRRESKATCVWFGVTIEYMVLSNKLKVSIERHGFLLTECGKAKRANLFAKVFLMPGNSKKQKLEVTSSMDMSSMVKPSVYLKGFSGRQLFQMELCVKIYLKQGIFKRPSVIHEWTVSMEDIDLIEPQTAWKKIEWR